MRDFKVGDRIRFVDDGELNRRLIDCHGVVISLFDDDDDDNPGCFGEVEVLDGYLKGRKIDTYLQHAELEDDNL